MRRSTIAQTLLLLLAPLTVLRAGAASQPTARPNIVIILRSVQDRAKEKEPFFLYFALTSPHEPIVPSQDFQGKSGIAPIADFVMQTDWSVGQVVEAIDNAGLAEDTVIVFTADNGHSHYTGWEQLVAAGHRPSRHGQQAANDTMVRFDTTQEKRWAPALDH